MSLRSRITALENTPEAKNKPVIVLFIHDDGRVCNQPPEDVYPPEHSDVREPVRFYSEAEVQELEKAYLVIKIRYTSDPPRRT